MADEFVVELTDVDILTRLRSTEDNFVERKRFSDDREWLRTVVGFANSCPIGYPGLLFIGAYDSGQIERPKAPINLDSLQKSLAERITEAWPPIYVLPKIMRENGQEFLAVLVPGSTLRPHFAGHSFVRVGSETKKASEQQFSELIAQRSSKYRAIEKMKGQQVVFDVFGGKRASGNVTVTDCNQFFVTFDGGTWKQCWPLEWIFVSFDPNNRRHHLLIQHPPT